jgi:membrane protease YdiL (CAAX protease family)
MARGVESTWKGAYDEESHRPSTRAMYSGVLYKALRDRWGTWLGATLSSLVFAVLHGNLRVGIVTFLIGLLCVFAYEKSQSLWSAIIIHTVNNSISLILLYSMLVTNMPFPWV